MLRCLGEEVLPTPKEMKASHKKINLAVQKYFSLGQNLRTAVSVLSPRSDLQENTGAGVLLPLRTAIIKANVVLTCLLQQIRRQVAVLMD